MFGNGGFEMEKSYLCIDLKSFFASVECIERGLDAMTTNLVVADEDRTEKTIDYRQCQKGICRKGIQGGYHERYCGSQ